MLSKGFIEGQENVINLPHLDGDIVKEMLYFMYSDKVRNLDTLAYDLLIQADIYDLEKLKRVCEKYLINNITVNSTGDVVAVSDVANCYRLKEKALEYMVSNASEVSTSDSWHTTVAKRPGLYKDAFESLAKKRKETN